MPFDNFQIRSGAHLADHARVEKNNWVKRVKRQVRTDEYRRPVASTKPPSKLEKQQRFLQGDGRPSRGEELLLIQSVHESRRRQWMPHGNAAISSPYRKKGPECRPLCLPYI